MLLRDLLRARREIGQAEFGIIGIRAGHEVGDHGAVALHDVGSAARLVEVGERNDGSYDVVAEGSRRFRLDGLIEDRRTPYLVGSVTWLSERVRDPELVATLTPVSYTHLDVYKRQVGQSAVVHGLTDDIVEAGVPLAEAVEVLLAELAGRLMVCLLYTSRCV